ncbi:MAG: nucleotidyltransferase domain-containing protein [bacterium]
MEFSTIIPILEREPRVIAVYVLGSAARDALRPDSDIDLALLPAPGTSLPLLELANLATLLTQALGRQVDLGVLSSLNLVYARQALLTGHCIYRRPFSEVALMVANLLGLYACFQDERQEILRAYTAG